jgi:signal transduction histidine kinase
VVEQAGFLLRRSMQPPSDEAGWQTILLPDDWSVSRPDAEDVGWYRIEVHLEEPPRGIYGVYIPRRAASQLTAFVNGLFVGGARGLPDPKGRLTPQTLRWSIPPSLLRQGRNVMHLRVVADASYREGLTRVYFGGAPEVADAVTARDRMQGLAHRVFGFASVVLGCAALVVWLRQRRDTVIGWLGLSAIAGGLGPALYDVVGWEPAPAVRDAVVMLYAYAFVPPLLMALPRPGRAAARSLTIASWGVLGFASVALLALGPGKAPAIVPYVGLFYACAIVVTIAACLLAGRSVVGPGYLPLLMLAAAGLAAVLLVHDLAIWFGYLDFDRIVLRPLVPAALALVTTAVLLSRHLGAYRALQRSHAELERRVADRTHQLEENFERIRELERVRSAAAERHRIVADMHDGLGGTLVRLLSLIRNGASDRSTLANELEQALIELRLSFDSMEDFDHDLLVLLGAVRHRLSRSFELAGIEIDWRVEALPRTGWLTPQRSHHLQRLLLEVFTNAIRHANADRIAVAVERTDRGRVRVAIEDNGRGCDLAHGAPGRGISNIRKRSEALDSELAFESAPGRGTRVTLELPKEVLGSALADAAAGQEPGGHRHRGVQRVPSQLVEESSTQRSEVVASLGGETARGLPKRSRLV